MRPIQPLLRPIASRAGQVANQAHLYCRRDLSLHGTCRAFAIISSPCAVFLLSDKAETVYAPMCPREVKSLLRVDVSSRGCSFNCLTSLADQKTRVSRVCSASTCRWSFVAAFISHCAVYMAISVIISPFLAFSANRSFLQNSRSDPGRKGAGDPSCPGRGDLAGAACQKWKRGPSGDRPLGLLQTFSQGEDTVGKSRDTGLAT